MEKAQQKLDFFDSLRLVLPNECFSCYGVFLSVALHGTVYLDSEESDFMQRVDSDWYRFYRKTVL